jgi:hypothetical protein
MLVFSERTAVLDLLGILFKQIGVQYMSYDCRKTTKEKNHILAAFKASIPGKNQHLLQESDH